MTTFVVTFEINDPIRRNKIKEILRHLGAYCPIHENTWAISTDKSAVQIRDAMMSALASVDRTFVIRSGTEAAWSNAYGKENNDWLKEWL